MRSSSPGHIAVDVHYVGQLAVVAAVVFADWNASEESHRLVLQFGNIAPYVSGSFYLRELPCLEKIIESLDCAIATIVIDGYVTLGSQQILVLECTFG